MSSEILFSPEEKVFSLIVQYLLFVDKILLSTRRILNCAEAKKYNETEYELINRERLISLLSKIQSKIEYEENSIEKESSSEDMKEILTCWKLETINLIENIRKIDEEITQKLESSKEQLRLEMSLAFKAKETHKGYNLNSLKR